MAATRELSFTELNCAFGTVDEMIAERRAVYDVVIRYLSDVVPGVSVLDNPLVRAHLAEVIGGRAEIREQMLQSMTDWGLPPESGDGPLVVAAPKAAEDFAAVLAHVETEVGGALRILTCSGREWTGAQRRVTEGIALLRRHAGDLEADLLPHVAGFALVEPVNRGRLGSASARDWPGLVVLPATLTPFDVAEAIVHEGAHQKFFDICLTRDVLAISPSKGSFFEPPWHDDEHWPIEQALAACHAYRGLEDFGEAMGADIVSSSGQSLVPVAADRRAALTKWLLHHLDCLGPDGIALVRLLAGEAAQRSSGSGSIQDIDRLSGEVIVRRVGRRRLVLRAHDTGIQLFWID
jgi:hypothetical protein